MNVSLSLSFPEESESKRKKTNKKSSLEEQRCELDQLIKKLEIESKYKESFRLANEQLEINAKKEAEVNRALTKELDEQKAHIQKLNQELEKARITNDMLKAENEKLLQVNTYRLAIRTLEEEVEKHKQDLEKMKAGKDTLKP